VSEPAKPSGGDELVEMEAMDLEEWERDKHTPQAGKRLDELVKQTAAAPPAPPTATRSTQSIARTVTRTPAAGVGVAKPADGNPFDGPTVRNAGAGLAAAQKSPQTPPGGSPIARITPTKVATPPQGTPVGRNTMVRTPALGVGVGAPAAATRTDAAPAPARAQTPAAGVGVPGARPTAAQPPQTPPPRPTGAQPPQTPPPRAAAPPPTPTSTRTQALPIVTRAPASAPVASVRVPDKAKPRVEETEGWSLPDDEPAKPAAPAAAKSAAPAKPAAGASAAPAASAAKPATAKITPVRAQSPDPTRIVAPKPKLEALQAENWSLDDSAIEDPYAPKDADANLGSVPIAALAGQVTPTPSAPSAAKPASPAASSAGAAKPAPPPAAKPAAPPTRPATNPANATNPATGAKPATPQAAKKPDDAVDFDSPFAAATTVGTLDDDLPIAIAPAASGARPFVESVSPASSPAIDPLNPPTLDPDALRTLDPDALDTMDPDGGDLAVAGDDLAVPSATDDSDESDDGDLDDLSEFPPAPVVVAPAASGRRNTPAAVHTLAPPMGALPTDPSLPPSAAPQRNTPPPMQAVSPDAAPQRNTPPPMQAVAHVDAFAQTQVPPSRMQTPIPPSTSQPIPTFRPPSQPELFEAEDARSARDQRAIKTDMFAAQKPPGSKNLFFILGGAAVVVIIILFFVLRGDKTPTVATKDQPVATKGSDVIAPTPPPEVKGSDDTAGSSATPETHEPVAIDTPPETHEPATPETHEPSAPVTHEPTTNPPTGRTPTGRTPTGRTPTGRTPKNPKGNRITTAPATPVETANPSDGGAAKTAYADGNKALYAADAQGAITHFKAALAAQPGFAAAHRGLGLAYSLSGNKAQAVSEFKAYLAASPGAKDAAKIQERITALQK
jgi:hypothetical protein